VPNGKITILVNQKPYHLDKSILSPQEFRDLVGAPGDYEVWLIVKEPDPEGQLPIDDVQITSPVEIKSGQRYRVVPPGTFGSAATSATQLSQLAQEVEELKNAGHAVELVEGAGWANVLFHQYSLPPGYNKKTTELLLKMPMSYPSGRPDMFWTDEGLTLQGGGIPKSAETIEMHLGKRWRRFSWHPQNWVPGVDNLRSFLEFVNNRLSKSV
jgi:Prokaryotic E2 family E